MGLYRNLTLALLCSTLSFSMSLGMEKLIVEGDGSNEKTVATASQEAEKLYQEAVSELKSVMTLQLNGVVNCEQIEKIMLNLKGLATAYAHEQALELLQLMNRTFIEDETPVIKHAGLVLLHYFVGNEEFGFALMSDRICKNIENVGDYLNQIFSNESIVTNIFCQLLDYSFNKLFPEEKLSKIEKTVLDCYLANSFNIFHASKIFHYEQFIIGQCYLRALHSSWLNNIDTSQSEQVTQAQNRVAAYLGIGLKYIILSAKQGNEDAYKALLLELKSRQAYKEYYKKLLPLLQAEDPQAQDLFNKVAWDHTAAFKHFDNSARMMYETDRENPLIPTVKRVIEQHNVQLNRINFTKQTVAIVRASGLDKASSALEENLTPQEQFKKAMRCWDSTPDETLRLFFDILGNTKSSSKLRKDVNKRLAEIKNMSGYKKPNTVKQADQLNNIGYLLWLGEQINGPKTSTTKQEVKPSQGASRVVSNSSSTTTSSSTTSKSQKKPTLKSGQATHKENLSPNPKVSQNAEVTQQSPKAIDLEPRPQAVAPTLMQDVSQPMAIEMPMIEAVPQVMQSEIEQIIDSKVFGNEVNTNDTNLNINIVSARDIDDSLANQSQPESTAPRQEMTVRAPEKEKVVKTLERRPITRSNSLNQLSTPSFDGLQERPGHQGNIRPYKKEQKEPREGRILRRTQSLRSLPVLEEAPLKKQKEKKEKRSLTISLKQYLKPEEKRKRHKQEKQKAEVKGSDEAQTSQNTPSGSGSNSGTGDSTFKKLTRKLSNRDLIGRSSLSLSESDFDSTLSELEEKGKIKYRRENNTISATNTNDQNSHLTIHTHNKSDTPWYERPEIVKDFLEFSSECDDDIKSQVNNLSSKR